MVKKSAIIAIINQRTKILYRSALICYVLPFVLLTFFLLDNSITKLTDTLFGRAFLLSMFPMGLLGLLFSIIGIIQSTRIHNYKKRSNGYYYLFMGIIVIVAGIFGWMLLYVTTS